MSETFDELLDKAMKELNETVKKIEKGLEDREQKFTQQDVNYQLFNSPFISSDNNYVSRVFVLRLKRPKS